MSFVVVAHRYRLRLARGRGWGRSSGRYPKFATKFWTAPPQTLKPSLWEVPLCVGAKKIPNLAICLCQKRRLSLFSSFFFT